MGSKKGEGLIILYTIGPCIMEASGVCGIKPTTLAIEAHQLFFNKVNPIVTLNIYISICLLIALLLILGFIILNLLVNEIGPLLESFTSTLAMIHIYELILVLLNLLLVLLVWATTNSMVGCITI